MADAVPPNERGKLSDGGVMPHTKTEVRQADRAPMPLRVLIISTTAGAAILGAIALGFMWLTTAGGPN